MNISFSVLITSFVLCFSLAITFGVVFPVIFTCSTSTHDRLLEQVAIGRTLSVAQELGHAINKSVIGAEMAARRTKFIGLPFASNLSKRRYLDSFASGWQWEASAITGAPYAWCRLRNNVGVGSVLSGDYALVGIASTAPFPGQSAPAHWDPAVMAGLEQENITAYSAYVYAPDTRLGAINIDDLGMQPPRFLTRSWAGSPAYRNSPPARITLERYVFGHKLFFTTITETSVLTHDSDGSIFSSCVAAVEHVSFSAVLHQWLPGGTADTHAFVIDQREKIVIAAANGGGGVETYSVRNFTGDHSTVRPPCYSFAAESESYVACFHNFSHFPLLRAVQQVHGWDLSSSDEIMIKSDAMMSAVVEHDGGVPYEAHSVNIVTSRGDAFPFRLVLFVRQAFLRDGIDHARNVAIGVAIGVCFGAVVVFAVILAGVSSALKVLVEELAVDPWGEKNADSESSKTATSTAATSSPFSMTLGRLALSCMTFSELEEIREEHVAMGKVIRLLRAFMNLAVARQGEGDSSYTNIGASPSSVLSPEESREALPVVAVAAAAATTTTTVTSSSHKSPPQTDDALLGVGNDGRSSDKILQKKVSFNEEMVLHDINNNGDAEVGANDDDDDAPPLRRRRLPPRAHRRANRIYHFAPNFQLVAVVSVRFPAFEFMLQLANERASSLPLRKSAAKFSFGKHVARGGGGGTVSDVTRTISSADRDLSDDRATTSSTGTPSAAAVGDVEMPTPLSDVVEFSRLIATECQALFAANSAFSVLEFRGDGLLVTITLRSLARHSRALSNLCCQLIAMSESFADTVGRNPRSTGYNFNYRFPLFQRLALPPHRSSEGLKTAGVSSPPRSAPRMAHVCAVLFVAAGVSVGVARPLSGVVDSDPAAALAARSMTIFGPVVSNAEQILVEMCRRGPKTEGFCFPFQRETVSSPSDSEPPRPEESFFVGLPSNQQQRTGGGVVADEDFPLAAAQRVNTTFLPHAVGIPTVIAHSLLESMSLIAVHEPTQMPVPLRVPVAVDGNEIGASVKRLFEVGRLAPFSFD